ncbi:MAG: thioredoxin family protein [Desulfurivibrionaceae bacterium]|nr:thioredoxin family protein [Desulfurivibrionaceae bacterium]
MKSVKTRVILYHSILCPRCHLAGRALAGLKEDFPGLEISRVEVTLQPLTALAAGVRMIPSLVAGTRKLSGIMLSKTQIRAFLNQL